MSAPDDAEDQPRSDDHAIRHARVSREALDAHIAVRGEGDEWDFKATLGDLTKAASRVSLAKDALAFANLPEGGTIIVGVANDFTRVGLADTEHLDTTNIRLAIEKYIDGDFVVVAAEHVVTEEDEEPKRFGIVHFSRRSLQPVIAAEDGRYSNERSPEFRNGDILVRRGAASTRANTADVRRLLTSSVVSQERMDATKELWMAVVELRELLGGVETLFDTLALDEYGDVPRDPKLRAFVTLATDFELATRANEIGHRVRVLRPLLADQLYLHYWLYGAFIGRVQLKVLRQLRAGVFKSWTELDNGAPDTYLYEIASRLVEAAELQPIWSATSFRPIRPVLDAVERDISAAIRSVLGGLT